MDFKELEGLVEGLVPLVGSLGRMGLDLEEVLGGANSGEFWGGTGG